jgi:signal transduction histidine kinase
MSAAAFMLTSVVTVVSSFTSVDLLEERVPDELADTILILGVPAIAALLVLVAWQSHGVMAAAAEEIVRSERRLEQARADEQRRVERRLEATVTGHLDQAHRLVETASRALAAGEAPDAALDDAGQAVRDANVELRALAAGLHSAVLAGQGLAPALAALGARSRVPLEVDVPELRLPDETERAVYQCVAAVVETIAPGTARAGVSVQTGRGDVGVVIDVRSEPGCRVPGLDEGAQLAVDRALALDGTAAVPVASPDRTVVTLTVPVRDAAMATSRG